MDHLKVNVKSRLCIIILIYGLCNYANAWNTEYVHSDTQFSDSRPHIVNLHERVRREVPTEPVASTLATPTATVANGSASLAPVINASRNATDDSNRTINVTKPTTSIAIVTRVPLLGQNGSGQMWPKGTYPPTVSNPISAGDTFTDMFKETPETIKAEQNLTSLTYVNFEFYNSSFIGNASYFDEYWTNITKGEAQTNLVLSNTHRHASNMNLSFPFPFYGHYIRSVSVATGGFIYTGEHVHNWLAATQYIAPLMGNFDTSARNDSFIKMYYGDDKCTVLWENVVLQENKTEKFTFAATLYRNGDITFAYKDIPISVQDIIDDEHPVKVGISDAYLNDRIIFFVRRKTIYEYHRINYKNHEIKSKTILRMIALPTCLQYESCDTCLNHNTTFNCTWCEQIQKCSSGTDRNKQDWKHRGCESSALTNSSVCPARTPVDPSPDTEHTAYRTEDNGTSARVDVRTLNVTDHASAAIPHEKSAHKSTPEPSSSGVGGVIAACVAIATISSVAAWILYAFKNPHTRSGQLLIKYRPSQWNWRRGEARYTAATIHM